MVIPTVFQYSPLASAPDIVLGMSCLEDAMIGSPSGLADLLGLDQNVSHFVTAGRFTSEEQRVFLERLIEILSGVKNSKYPNTQKRLKDNLQLRLKRRREEKEKKKSTSNFERVCQAETIHEAASFLRSRVEQKEYEEWLNRWLVEKRVWVLLHTKDRLEALMKGEDSPEAWIQDEVKNKMGRKIRRRYKLGSNLFWGAFLTSASLISGGGIAAMLKGGYTFAAKRWFPAVTVSRLYANDFDGFTQADCEKLPVFDGPQCRLLSKVLGKGINL